MKTVYRSVSASLMASAWLLALVACQATAEREHPPLQASGPDDTLREAVAGGASAQPRSDERPGEETAAPATNGENSPVVPGANTDAPAPYPRTDQVGSEANVLEDDNIRDVEMHWLLSKARRQMEANDLEGADSTLSFALERDPGNAEAQNLRNQVRMNLSQVGPGGTDQVENEYLATIEEYTVEAEKLYNAARAAEIDQHWAEAERLYTELLTLMRFAPYKAELKDKYEVKANAGLHSAQVNASKQRTRNEEEQKAEALRIAQLRGDSERDRRRERIVELWRQAIYDLELRKFNRARDLVNEILALDPNFEQAKELRATIDDERIKNMRRDTFEQKVLGYRHALLEIRKAMIPMTESVAYPSGELARRIQERVGKLPDAVRLNKETLATQARLDSTVMSFQYPEGTKLKDIVRDIRREAGVNVMLDQDIESKEVPALALESIPLSSALRIIATQLELSLSYSHGILMIRAAGAASGAKEDMITRVHDVRDITFELNDFPGPTLDLRGTAGTDTASTPTPPRSTTDPPTVDDVIDLIKDGVHADWDPAGGAGVARYGGQLVVTNTAAVQAEVKTFLDQLRSITGLLVAMEARFISIEDNYLTDFGIDFRGLGGPGNVPNQAQFTMEDIRSNAEDNAGGAFDNGAFGVAAQNPSAGIFFMPDDPNGPVNFNRDIRLRFENIYDNALGNRLTNAGGLAMQIAIFKNLTQINAVIEAVTKKGKARTLIAPRLAAYNTQRANVAIVSQVPYVSDFEVRQVTGATIADPKIDYIINGVVLEILPTVSNDRRFITLEVKPTVAELLLPMPTFTTTLGTTGSTAVTIQIPELQTKAVRTTVRVPDGGAVVIGGLRSMRDVDLNSGTPVLSDLPLLGTLFRSKGRSTEQSNLVVIVKAQIVDLADEELRQPGWH